MRKKDKVMKKGGEKKKRGEIKGKKEGARKGRRK